MLKIKISFTVLLTMIFATLPLDCKANHQKQRAVRVAISDNQFEKFAYGKIEIIATGECNLYKINSSSHLAKVPRNQTIKIELANGNFTVIIGGNKCLKNIREDIVIKCSNGFLGVKNLQRLGKQALYRGNFEIIKTNNKQFFLINVVAIEDYLKSVVPNEMPIKFGFEALKAQAVVARNYALSPRIKEYKEFDLYDSVASQVYFGINTEYPTSNKAIKETEGLVLLYNWDLILALYFSTSCGHTETYENAFADSKTNMFSNSPLPYLRGKPDNPTIGDLSNENVARSFFRSNPKSFDVESKYFRWQKEWDVQELKNVLQASLMEQKDCGFIDGFSRNPNDLGDIQRISVKKRGVSGQVMELVVVTTTQKISIKKELIIRRVFKKDGNLLPSANFVFDHLKDKNGKLTKIIAYGGGFGHAVGMSQYGAGFMATHLNKTFDQILKWYYQGISIATVPAVLSANKPQNVVTQNFYTTKKTAALVIDNRWNIPSLQATINGKRFSLNLTANSSSNGNACRIDISRYIKNGSNAISFYMPSGVHKDKSIKLYVEISKPE
ncbi:MAG: SpoIID/LytB domain-containing protein [Puniceicoccales bacterium]|jgi:SpoIID/LytB domain protein|nr:SpoIID/LytB domain-containing protein [Puniceicoccales bacterium]